MIYERSFFILSCVTLSSLVSYSGSWATESTTVKPNAVSPKLIAQADSDQIGKEKNNLAGYSYTNFLQAANEIKSQNNGKPQKKLEQETEIFISRTDNEQPAKINKKWSLVGILITSMLFLFVLRVLFKKEPQHQEQETVLKLLPTQDKDSFDLIDDDNGMLQEEEMISSELFPMLSEDIIGESSHSLIENGISSRSTDVNMGEDQGEIRENAQAKETYDALDREIAMTSDTTEIDLVCELIKDLQQSDLQLRRKAIAKLSQAGDYRGIDPLISIMYQADSEDKSLILDAITQIVNRSFKPINNALFSSLEDEDSEIRKNAIHDLTALYECISQITKCLILQTLKDSDQEVQQTAKWALEQCNLVSFSSTPDRDRDQLKPRA